MSYSDYIRSVLVAALEKDSSIKYMVAANAVSKRGNKNTPVVGFEDGAQEVVKLDFIPLADPGDTSDNSG